MINNDTSSNISINRLYDAVLDIEDAVSELYIWQDGFYLDYVEPELYINISSEEAFNEYKKLADAGNALACCVVAVCYSSNHVVKYNERLEYFIIKKQRI
ncbi:MAG: hypothetical protein K6F69_07160 [Treponema sp.]|nr:hypothetical protein [Treponema sp.]